MGDLRLASINCLLGAALCCVLSCGSPGARPLPPPASATPSASLAQAPVSQPPPLSPLDAALSSPRRSAAERERDFYGRPKRTLEFFDVRPGQRVLELEPAQGYFTKILAEFLGDPVDGVPRLAVLSPRTSKEPHPGPLADYEAATRRLVAALPQPVEVLAGPFAAWADQAPRFDRVLAIRGAHIYAARGLEREIYGAAFKCLTPGGLLGVVAHRGLKDELEDGYLTEERVIRAITAAGFVLDRRAEINANAADDRVHPHGVWSLAPTLVDGPSFASIGESDRMTLRFRKP